MTCSYCCNKQQYIKNSFTRIKQSELINLPHRDFEITGGELTMVDTFGSACEIIRNWLPQNRNYYFYSNGLWFTCWHANILKRIKVKGINIGMHIGEKCITTNTVVKDYNWPELYKVHKILPIRLWVKDTDIHYLPDDLPFPIRIWTLGECDEIRTDRYKLHYLS